MNEVMRNRQLVRLAVCLVGMAAMVLQSCMEANGTDCDRLCGSWSSVEGKPDVLVYKEGGAYKVTVFSRSGKTRVLKPRTYLLVEENGNLFINTGYRIDVSYNEATDVLTFSPTVIMYVMKTDDENGRHMEKGKPCLYGVSAGNRTVKRSVGGYRSRKPGPGYH